MSLSPETFGQMLDQTGLTLTEAQKSVLFDVPDVPGHGRPRHPAAASRSRTRRHLSCRRCGDGPVPDHRRSRAADRGEATLAGRTDPALPGPHRHARRHAAQLSCWSPKTAPWPMPKPPRRRMMAGALKGPLDGIPIGTRTSTTPPVSATTAHSQLLEHNVPAEDAVVVREAGRRPAPC